MNKKLITLCALLFSGLSCVFAGPNDKKGNGCLEGNSLTQSEKTAIALYVGEYHRDINSFLKGEEVQANMKLNVKETVNTISSIINRLGGIQNRTLYRGTHEQDFIGANISSGETENLIGKIIVFPAFTSTSSDESVALSYSGGEILYIINSNNAHSLDINKVFQENDLENAFSNENEFLFDKNQKFKIVSVEKNKGFFNCENPISVKLVVTLKEISDFFGCCRI